MIMRVRRGGKTAARSKLDGTNIEFRSVESRFPRECKSARANGGKREGP